VIPFDEKIRKVVSEVFRILGYPEPLEIEDKYLLSNFDPKILPVAAEAISITQTYLLSPEKGVEERVRMRGWLDSASYFHTTKRPAGNGARIEVERTITQAEYVALLERADPKKAPIEKTRFCFVYENQYFEADVFKGKLEGLFLLEREKTSVNEATALPPFLDVVSNVTDDPHYKNSALAAKA
jgi:CYTH domain-containing protein